ncbi:MAG: (d)CMP kinase [Clostridia bacterium]|nr:(d)CMP kinase [Clostridia bacterium]
MIIKYENAFDCFVKLIKEHNDKNPLIIAFDGRSASGKSSLSERLTEELNMPVIHTDDFYRPKNNKGELEISEFDGNFDIVRFKREVVEQLKNKTAFKYGIFDCKFGRIEKYNEIDVSNCCIIEGAYSLNPNLGVYADIKVFFDVDEETQKQRILRRNGEKQLENFKKIWLPAEERYLEHYQIKKSCDIIVNS